MTSKAWFLGSFPTTGPTARWTRTLASNRLVMCVPVFFIRCHERQWSPAAALIVRIEDAGDKPEPTAKKPRWSSETY